MEKTEGEEMKTQEEREDDIMQLFDSILSRLNELRKRETQTDDEIVFTDKEKGIAIKDYCETYKDEITYFD